MKTKPTSAKEESLRIGTLIRKHRLASGLEQKQLAAILEVPASSVSGWESGFTRPKLEIIKALCETIDLSVLELLGLDPRDALSTADKKTLKSYNRLSRYNRETIDELMDRLYFTQDKAEKKRLREEYEVITAYTASAAAGIGETLPDYEEKEDVYLRSDSIPSGADCIIRVNGASMKPKYPDGCYVYVDTKAEVQIGQVGVFIMDGESYIKELRENGLHSYNPCYAFKPIYESTNIRCFGKVIGIVDEADWPTGQTLTKIIEAYEEEKA